MNLCVVFGNFFLVFWCLWLSSVGEYRGVQIDIV